MILYNIFKKIYGKRYNILKKIYIFAAKTISAATEIVNGAWRSFNLF
jgi:hypothetical protein